ncbi:PPOX class F420-dependent oxidoreductase [Williamsia sp. 1135]|uniref:PPOX class F420-dependent oxidoreductase n=1 Tax=Williamsia sp. 1135 TaxID=1889262 RepID=UPI000A115217|nr:PPOX class F420-dependent oxidoreductase [Williamsia sp. 1135]ORM38149.1 pyridoxamine 5'-phosphate oxidase [Williamsia sp. 1135]
MTFTNDEIEYLNSQDLGRLATAQPNGTLQASPVGFTCNIALGTIDITGYNMAASQKFKNLATNPTVAFVVDDIVSREPWRVRCLEIRGTAEQVGTGSERGNEGPLIRIHPTRIISFGLAAGDLDVEPHQIKPHKRTLQ